MGRDVASDRAGLHIGLSSNLLFGGAAFDRRFRVEDGGGLELKEKRKKMNYSLDHM